MPMHVSVTPVFFAAVTSGGGIGGRVMSIVHIWFTASS
jgi:hypothetical protein